MQALPGAPSFVNTEIVQPQCRMWFFSFPFLSSLVIPTSTGQPRANPIINAFKRQKNKNKKREGKKTQLTASMLANLVSDIP